MAVNEILLERMRNALSHLPSVEEKKMFGGIAFMVNSKMCVTITGNRMMCRVDPKLYEKLIRHDGTSTMLMKGKKLKGYIHIDGEFLKTKKQLYYWMELALAYNKIAQISKNA